MTKEPDFVGLNDNQKLFVLDFALWKIDQLLQRPFKYRTGCFLMKKCVSVSTESLANFASELPNIDISMSIKQCNFDGQPVTDVYYPADKLYKPSSDTSAEDTEAAEEEAAAEEAEE